MADPSVQIHMLFFGVDGYVVFGWISILFVKCLPIDHQFGVWEMGSTIQLILYFSETCAVCIFLWRGKS